MEMFSDSGQPNTDLSGKEACTDAPTAKPNYGNIAGVIVGIWFFIVVARIGYKHTCESAQAITQATEMHAI